VKKNKQSNSEALKVNVIEFLNPSRRCEFKGSPSILEVAISHDVGLNHSCGGMGSCTTCRVFIKKGIEKVGQRNEVEKEHAQMRGFVTNERLACQTLAVEGLIIEIPDSEI
jgi:2Fe-2S ferredoxin